MRGSVEDYSFEETAEDLELEVHDVERVYGALVDDVIDLATSFALSSDADFAATHLIEGMTAMPNTVVHDEETIVIFPPRSAHYAYVGHGQPITPRLRSSLRQDRGEAITRQFNTAIGAFHRSFEVIITAGEHADLNILILCRKSEFEKVGRYEEGID